MNINILFESKIEEIHCRNVWESLSSRESLKQELPKIFQLRNANRFIFLNITKCEGQGKYFLFKLKFLAFFTDYTMLSVRDTLSQDVVILSKKKKEK